MWFLYFFGGLNQTEKQALLEFKRPQLVAVDWKRPGFPPITVQKGKVYLYFYSPTPTFFLQASGSLPMKTGAGCNFPTQMSHL